MQLTKALANEWAPHGINVNGMAQGFMRRDNTAALLDSASRVGVLAGGRGMFETIRTGISA
jgi:NAD(P)-dependent dehydrogenase (short-subunit alcohol dehydrogenase family)